MQAPTPAPEEARASAAAPSRVVDDDEGFTEPVTPGGYAWWYIDAISDDGEHALTAIYFIGSVFSPSYAGRARRGERVAAEQHLGVNLALYRRGKRIAWVMSEYAADALVERRADALTIARSSLIRTPNGPLVARVCDREAPFMLSMAGVGGMRVDGEMVLEPACAPISGIELAEAGSGHRWKVPIPRARLRVKIARPSLSFEGWAYHDTNRGETRLEETLSRWSWARVHERDRLVVLYTTEDRRGRRHSVLVDAKDGAPARDRLPQLVPNGTVEEPRAVGWGLTLPAGFSVDGGRVRATPERVLDVAPFYARYEARLYEGGAPRGLGVGEHLDLDRFRRPGIQFLLRFKTRDRR
jgi:carotenoid 1,2-hydratase